MPQKPKTLQVLSLILLLALTAMAILLLITPTRERILGSLFPLHRSEAITINSLQIKEDYSNQILTLELRLKNTSDQVVYPLGAQSELQLNTTKGQRVSPHQLPNSQSLIRLEPQAQWRGQFSWWLKPEQVNQPLRLSWLNEQVTLLEEEEN